MNAKFDSMEVKSGTILVAHPNLRDPFFSGSVILILDKNDGGTLGANIAPALVLPGSKDLPPCYLSGPMEGVFVLHELTIRQSSTPIGDSGYALGTGIPKADLPSLAQAPSTVLLLGYAGWGPEQLEDEMDAGAWQPTTLTLSELLKASVDERWKLAAQNAGFVV